MWIKNILSAQTHDFIYVLPKGTNRLHDLVNVVYKKEKKL